MARKSQTYGKVTGGKLSLLARDRFVNSFRNWDDCEIELVVKQVEPKRSDPANRYYWGVIIPIAMQTINDEWGATYGKEHIHQILKEHCNQVDHETSSGRVIRIAQDTHDMPHSEFCQFVERCRGMLVEYFGVDTPDPQKFYKSPQPAEA